LTFIASPDPDALPGAARSWTYSEFLADVHRAANLFRTLAAGEEPRIAMLLPSIPQAWFTLWGGESIGVVCPINYLLGTEHIAELVRASGANIFVTLGPHAELDIWSRAVDLQAQCPSLRHVLAVGAPQGTVDFDAALAAASTEAPTPLRVNRCDNTAALFHTGGTTGAPKLARHTHGNQLHAAAGAAAMYDASERDVILNGFPLFHVAGSIVYGLSVLLAGGEVVLPTLTGLRNKRFVDHYWHFVDRQGITLLAAVPTVIATVLESPRSQDVTQRVRLLLTGGSPLPAELAAEAEKRLGIPLRNILGMTECAGVIAIEPAATARTEGACGLPLPFTRVRATDGQGQPLQASATGILQVSGPNVSPGYTDAERNAGTFTADGWLITGDLGHVDAQGRVFVTGRAKDLIIRSSHNIDPGVIEDALLRHPDVLMAAAVGEPDEYAGELPIAYVVLKPGASQQPEALADFARPFIPERPAWPRRVELLEALPLTAIGKVYKPALRARASTAVIADRVQRAGLSQVQTQVLDDPAGLRVLFTTLAPADATTTEALRQVMRGFALAYSVGVTAP
jgi:fatty-acyl-CoA synthase